MSHTPPGELVAVLRNIRAHLGAEARAPQYGGDTNELNVASAHLEDAAQLLETYCADVSVARQPVTELPPPVELPQPTFAPLPGQTAADRLQADNARRYEESRQKARGLPPASPGGHVRPSGASATEPSASAAPVPDPGWPDAQAPADQPPTDGA